MQINLKGMDDAEKQMKRIERGTAAMHNYAVEVGSKLPYAYGIETGYHRKSGKLARRAGGSNFITKAVETVIGDMDRDISAGMNKVTAPGVWILKRLALFARRVARKNAVKGPKNKKHNYRLKKSILYRVRKL